MSKSSYISVTCKSCEKSYDKRKDTIKDWGGRCKKCSSAEAKISDKCRRAAAESGKRKTKEYSDELSNRIKELWKSDVFRKKFSDTRKEKYESGWHHYNWKGGAVYDICIDCGKELSSQTKKKKRCRKCYGKSKVGTKRPLYIGLKISEAKRKVFGNKYPQSELRKKRREYGEWRKLVFIRDEYRCVECGSSESLEGHHIKEVCNFPELIYDVDNGVCLCKSCHKKTSNYGFKAYNRLTHKSQPLCQL